MFHTDWRSLWFNRHSVGDVWCECNVVSAFSAKQKIHKPWGGELLICMKLWVLAAVKCLLMFTCLGFCDRTYDGCDGTWNLHLFRCIYRMSLSLQLIWRCQLHQYLREKCPSVCSQWHTTPHDDQPITFKWTYIRHTNNKLKRLIAIYC